jgi:hypothetical protein
MNSKKMVKKATDCFHCLQTMGKTDYAVAINKKGLASL